ncbi:MAG: 4-(cytidine 5'-diphospho)-2-C-methyl-D-erythritol kinase [Pseudomonadota bacterium]
MMARYRAFAAAKVNLFLHVGPARTDGRHPLDSLVVFAGREACDVLDVAEGPADRLEVSGPFAGALDDPAENLVSAALSRLRGQARISPERDRPVVFSLAKYLPIAAGLGGGSANAAAALRVLTRDVFDLPVRVAKDLAPQLGGDVCVCLENVPSWMRGDGDDVEPVRPGRLRTCLTRGGDGGLPAVLVNSGVPCPTGPVFRAYDRLGPRRLDLVSPPSPTDRSALYDWLDGATRNDLQAAAIALVPEIEGVLADVSACSGARLVRLSGSGATVFALFDAMDDALLAQSALTRAHPGWWVRATRLGEGL